MEEGYACMNGSRQSGAVSLDTSPSDGAVAIYSNQQASSVYLTPTSPSPSQAQQHPTFPASLAPPLTLPLRSQRRNHPFPREDSGIEADSPRSPTSLSASTTGIANPHVSTLYEYIDPKDVHVVPEQHYVNRNNTTQGESSSSGISSATTVAAYSGGVMSDSEEGTNVLRRRVNPMYEALEQSATRLYAQTCHCKTQSSAHRQLRYLWCGFIVLIVLIAFLSSVLAYVLFMLVPDLKSHVLDQDDRLLLLETGYGKLVTENQQLLQIFGTESMSDTSMAASMVDRISQLNNTVWTFGSQLDEISSDLHQQISNISLTPGPQGPPGVGNLSMCYYSSSTAYMALPSSYSTTSWMPVGDILKDYIVMSATCGVIGGTQHFVEAQERDPSFVQFRCRCDGSVENYDRRACKIHLVLCPRLSGQNSTPA